MENNPSLNLSSILFMFALSLGDSLTSNRYGPPRWYVLVVYVIILPVINALGYYLWDIVKSAYKQIKEENENVQPAGNYMMNTYGKSPPAQDNQVSSQPSTTETPTAPTSTAPNPYAGAPNPYAGAPPAGVNPYAGAPPSAPPAVGYPPYGGAPPGAPPGQAPLPYPTQQQQQPPAYYPQGQQPPAYGGYGQQPYYPDLTDLTETEMTLPTEKPSLTT